MNGTAVGSALDAVYAWRYCSKRLQTQLGWWDGLVPCDEDRVKLLSYPRGTWPSKQQQ